MRKLSKISIVVALVFFSPVIFGGTIAPIIPPPEGVRANDETALVTQAYRMYKDISPVLKVPTAVEVPFDNEYIERLNFAVMDITDKTFEPSLYIDRVNTKEVQLQALPTMGLSNESQLGRMFDREPRTFAEFLLPEAGEGRVVLNINGATSVTVSGLTLLLDNYVALPKYIEISAITSAGTKVVLAKTQMNSQTVRFPKTTAQNWMISLTYSQPLRITELKFIEENAGVVQNRGLRFLAQPNHAYRIFYDPDRYVTALVGEAANLYDDKGVLRLAQSAGLNNPVYLISDADGDSVPDITDNCVQTANLDQEDVNENGRGDVCDDFDRDGITNDKDNCKDKPNFDQRDTDGDKIGDVCDGEESRITEKYKWLPWLGIGFAAIVLLGLFIIAVRHPGSGEKGDGPSSLAVPTPKEPVPPRPESDAPTPPMTPRI
ncbi:MAG: thrombospondin type 3 repeat-containing protein [Candidatus Taylorbacteria bacterium]|nr:thrombospondin type 3 repeat-containing protein [Candidatus Taylorbacteria bacterium]